MGLVLFSFARPLIVSIVSPLWRAENVFSRTMARSFGYFHTQATLVSENASLREKVASLEIELSARTADSGNSLLEMVGRTRTSTGITTAVLTHPPQSPYDFLVVDAGERDGVVSGARVTLPEGPEVGTVFQTSSNSSRVKLFSASGEKTNAVLERHQVSVVLEGVGAGNFNISVPRETEVVVGDRIISPGLDSTLMAVVEDIKLSSTDSFKEVLAKSPVNIFSVRFVKILP